MSKDRELLKDFAAEWNKRTFQTGQNFINMKDIDSFLASRPEEKEENSTSTLNMNRGDKFHSCQHPLKNRFIDREGFERCSECHGYVENNSNPNNQ